MKLDFDSLCEAANSAGEPWHRKTIRAVWIHLARELASAGAPDAALDIQLRALLASHETMGKAGEEMPSAVDIERQCIHVVGPRGELVRDMMRPIIARLRKERDAARAELAARPAPIEPGQDMVEALIPIYCDAPNLDGSPSVLSWQAAVTNGTSDKVRNWVGGGIRAILSRLASMGAEALPMPQSLFGDAHTWATSFAENKRNTCDLFDGARAGYERGVFAAFTCLTPILAAKDARIRDLEAPAPDEPVADPTERARLVARELLARGIWARDMGNGVVIGKGKEFWYSMLWEDVATMGVRAITDRIQREEAKRAQAWAGDRT